MNAKYEFQNFVDHYGKAAALEAVADWLNDQACHCTDKGDNEGREVYDEAYDAIMLCVES